MRGEEKILTALSEKRPCDLAISLITYAEICYGIEKSPEKQEKRRRKFDAIVSTIEVIQMDIEAAHHYADIRVFLEKQGMMISERDLQIASVARANGLILVTHNTREFERVPELRVEDWS